MALGCIRDYAVGRRRTDIAIQSRTWRTIDEDLVCAHRCRRIAARGLTTSSCPRDTLALMSDFGQPQLQDPQHRVRLAPNVTRQKPAMQSCRPFESAGDRGIRVTWRRLDRLASAAVLLAKRRPASGNTALVSSAVVQAALGTEFVLWDFVLRETGLGQLGAAGLDDRP